MPERAAAAQALAAWREATQRLAAADPASPEWHAAAAVEEQARIAYHEAFAAAAAAHPEWRPPAEDPLAD